MENKTQKYNAFVKKIQRASARPMSVDETLKQQVSFIKGTLKSNSTITRDRIESEVKKLSGVG